MKRFVAGLGLALSLFVPAGADGKLEPPELDQYLRWGPLRVRPGIALTDVGYDDNILFNDQDKVSDFTATVSPKVEGLLLLGSRAFMKFNQRFDFVFYLENTQQNVNNNHSAVRLTYPLRRIGFFGDLGYDRANLRPIDLEQVLTERTTKKITGGLILTPNWRTEIEIGRTLADLSYDDPGIALRQDREERGTTVDATYRVFGRSRILLSTVNKKVDFVNPIDFAGFVIARDTRERRLLAGLGSDKRGRLSGSFRVGWATIDAEDPLLEDLSELVGDAELVFRFGSTTKMLITANRLPGYSVFEANSYYLGTRGGARVVRYLNRLIGVEIGGEIGKLTFPASVVGNDREDDLYHYDVGVRLRLSENAIGRKVEYSFRIGRYRRNSTLEAFNQNRNTAGFNAVLGF